ncbi:MAG: hypothetical protein ACLVKK_11730 [Ruthenibacterium sp.]
MKETISILRAPLRFFKEKQLKNCEYPHKHYICQQMIKEKEAIYNEITTNESTRCNQLYKEIQHYGKMTLKKESLFLCSATADYFVSA